MNIPTTFYSNSFEDSVRNFFDEFGILLVRNFPLYDEAALLKFMSLFGQPRKERYGDRFDYFHTLKVHEKPALNQKGYVTISSTNKAFDLHTDNYKKDLNAKIIGLLCVRPAVYGGVNYIVSVGDLLERLPVDVVLDMKAPIWPHPSGFIPLLLEGADGYSIRYGRSSIEEVAEVLEIELGERQLHVLDVISSASDLIKFSVRLESQDMLVLDNTRFLHGRSDFESNSARELIRWRINEA